MVIKFSKHFINFLLTLSSLYSLNIYEKLKLINKSYNLFKKLYIGLKMLIKAMFYKVNLKSLKLLNMI